jgi:NAD(P)-dependent dehydrogenase (short-subunit alcohol dehydrogenase family)
LIVLLGLPIMRCACFGERSIKASCGNCRLMNAHKNRQGWETNKTDRVGKPMKIIVMTGASSGIGKVAAQRLTERGHRVIGGVCDLTSPETVEALPLDLSNLDTVRAFAATLNTTQFDTLVLNAGRQAYDVTTRTAQGSECTFGVNRLAHYLLARLLLPQIRDGENLIFTSSGTHDPATKSAVPPPKHANAEWLAFPERDPTLTSGQ